MIGGGLSLKFKMLVAFLMVACFVVLVAASSYFTMEKVHTEYDFISRIVVSNLKVINQMGSKTHEANRHLLRAYMAVDEKQFAEHVNGWKENNKAFGDLQKIYEAVPFQAGESEVYDAFKMAMKDYQQKGEKFLSYLGSFDNESRNNALAFSDQELNPARTKMNETLDKLFLYHETNANEKSSVALSVYTAAKWVNSGLSLAGILLALVIAWIFSNSINSRLNSFSASIMSSSSQTSTASQELTSASSQLSQGATESAASLEETVSSLEELSSMVKLNSDHAKEANTLSQKSLNSAESGEKEIRNLIDAMSDMQKSSKKIEEIINVIDDIAFQTNLLALNAAVEAARAGDQGKGFAVVADAVRNLASRSASAAKDINGLIKENVFKTEQGAKIADKSGFALKEILTSVKKVADLNSEISAASNEQANGIEQISKAMNHLDQAIQVNASSSQEVASSADQMSSQADSLSKLVIELREFVSGSLAEKSYARPQPVSGFSSHQAAEVRELKGPWHTTASAPSPSAKVLPLDENEAKVGKAEGF